MCNHTSYKISFVLAITLHIALAVLLCIKIATLEKQPTTQSSTNIIKAFSINQNVVEKISSTVTETSQQVTIQQQQPSPSIQQPKPVEIPRPNLEQILKQQMLAAQAQELQTLKKELKITKKELTKTQQAAQQSKEKQILNNAFSDELSKEDKRLQKITSQLKLSGITNNTDKAITTNRVQTPAEQGEIDKYKALIVQAIAQEWIVPDDVDKNTSCKLLINLGPGGVVLRVQILQPSNNSFLDRSAQNAVWKASPLPVPKDNNLLDNFRSIQLTVHPEAIISQ